MIALLRIAFRLAVIGLIVWLVHLLIGWSNAQAAALKSGGQIGAVMLITLIFAYALLIAIPFVPGVELGIALMAMEGARIAPLIYLATVLGLMLAYAVGSAMPAARLRDALADFRLRKAAELLDKVALLDPAERLKVLEARLPRRIAGLGLRYRYVALGIMVNLPGNSLAGGGGGILLVAGFSRVFSFTGAVATMLIAVSPVPLLVWISGSLLPF
ncbi:MAG: hypothetical protein KGH84_00930 [Paracoccaceae bacterium]|nr:hypothetical protein [Paracoccaceae bacterium]